MNSDQLAHEVARLLRDQNLVVFVGAGISLGTREEQDAGLGLPNSSDLARLVANEFNVAFREGRSSLDGIASLAAEQTSDISAVKRFVARTIRDRAGSPLKTHEALARITPPLVLTTNYDGLYEKSLETRDIRYGKIVHQGQLSHTPMGEARVVKLHGDADDHTTLVLTGDDYLRWEREAEGFITEITADFQRSPCLFIGYSLRDPNLQRIVGLVRSGLGESAPRHFALVHEVDREDAARFSRSVRFVQGDATEFLEMLADLSAQEEPPTFDLAEEERNFADLIQNQQLEAGLESCRRLQEELGRRGAISTAADRWKHLAIAAEEANTKRVAAVAYTEAGRLFLEAGEDSSAERFLAKALENTRAANMPPQERQILPFLYEARLSGGYYYRVLQESEITLQAHGTDTSPDLLYALYSGRAEAKEALGDDEGARSEISAALEAIPREAVLLRTKSRCSLARILIGRAEWTLARKELDRGAAELLEAPGSVVDDSERRRGGAFLKLVRANMHQALGEDLTAVELYEDCERTFSETGDAALLISALQGSIYCRLLLGDFELETARARLRDHLRNSPEYRKIEEKEQQGVTTFAASKLAEARSNLLQAITAAGRVHNIRRERGIRHWYADVLRAAGDVGGALQQYVLAGDKKKSAEVAALLENSFFGNSAAFERLIAETVKVASEDNLPARRAALAALTAAADVLPEDAAASLAEHLSSMDSLPAGFFADRNLLSEAGELAREIMPMLSNGQASNVAKGLIRAICRTDCFPPTYGKLCPALSQLTLDHPDVVKELEVPVDRLTQLIGGDVINDTRNAMASLVDLARAGHDGAKQRAIQISRGGDSPWHVRWRHWLGDASEEELTATFRSVLLQSIDRVQQTEDGFHYGIGALSPVFFHDWDLPAEVRIEFVGTLSEAAADQSALIRDRQAAATMLGYKADQLDNEGRRRAIVALMPLLTEEVDVHPVTQSIDNPLSAIIMNVGQPADIKAAAAHSLLRLSNWMSEDQRRLLLREIEKLRASQVDSFGVSVSGGLRYFEPSGDEEQRWLQTRLLLLMNATHVAVRDNAAKCVGELVESKILEFNPELLDTLLFLASSVLARDRTGAAYALSRIRSNEQWDRPEVTGAVEQLRGDQSYSVRWAAQLG